MSWKHKGLVPEKTVLSPLGVRGGEIWSNDYNLRSLIAELRTSMRYVVWGGEIMSYDFNRTKTMMVERSRKHHPEDCIVDTYGDFGHGAESK